MVKVMTYNILMGGRSGRPLHEVVRATAPDVLLVNECPKAPLTWQWRCRRLAREWGLQLVVGGRPAGSNLILVRPGIGVTTATCVVLPQPRLEPRRGIASAQLEVGGELLGVVSCHLGLHPLRRRAEVAGVLGAADRLRGTVVVAGDLNEPPSGPAWEELRRAGFRDHGAASWPTFPAGAPDRRIDAVLVRGAGRVRHHGGPDVPERLLAAASDHCPVLVELDLPARPIG